MPRQQIRSHESALRRSIVPEIGVIESSSTSARIALIASEFPFVRRSRFIPYITEWQMSVSTCPSAGRVRFRTIGEMIRMVVCGGAAGNGDQQLRSRVNIFRTETGV